jgi:hypothetical protein
MSAMRLSPSRRREDIRRWWAAHVKAQRDCGRSQVDYCRAQGLDPKYFTLWKRKLCDPRAAAKTVESPRLIPVVVRSDRPAAVSQVSEVEPVSTPTGALVALRLSLGNGISVSLEVTTGLIPSLVRELASLRC